MLENLSPREREIFDLLLEGVSPKEISYKLNITLHTVAFHRTKLYNKLGVQSIQELFARYSTNGKALPPEANELSETGSSAVSMTKKNKRYKLLLSVGIVFVAFSVLFLSIFIRKSSAYTAPKGVIPITNLGFSSTSDQNEGGKSTSSPWKNL